VVKQRILSEQKECDARPYAPYSCVGRDIENIPTYSTKRSLRWIPDYNSDCSRVIGIPIVKVSGKFGLSVVAHWTCHPLQAIASMSATVFKRLQSVLIKRHGSRFAFGVYKLTLEFAICYSLSRDDWLIDRFLGISRIRSKVPVLRSILRNFVKDLDDDQRFVHSQASRQAYWLTSRSERPRDKSRDLKLPRILPFKGRTCGCDRNFCPYVNISQGDLCTQKGVLKDFRGYSPSSLSSHSDWSGLEDLDIDRNPQWYND
jgi:hypothetical protein